MVCQGRKMLDDSKSGPAAGLCYRVIGHVAGAELRVCRVIPGAGMHNSLVSPLFAVSTPFSFCFSDDINIVKGAWLARMWRCRLFFVFLRDPRPALLWLCKSTPTLAE
jgi:hypothetical protein